MRERDIVRHIARPDWGLGVVVISEADRHCEVIFEDHGRVKLALAVAASKLLAVASADVPATSGGLLDPSRWPAVERRATAVRCEHCREPLNESRSDASGQWKACSECSKRDGHQHVFHAYPDSFGAAQPREGVVASRAALRAADHCDDCRRKGRRAKLTGRPCSDVAAH